MNKPRNVRNFWIETVVDGLARTFSSGPVAQDGGFTEVVSIRRNGEVCDVLKIKGIAYPDGTLEIHVVELDPEVTGNVKSRIKIESHR